MSDTLEIQAQFPPLLIPSLFEKPWPRFRVYYGGRSAAKSWSIARMLLLEGIQRPLRILACREFLSAVSSSLHRLFSDQIGLLNLGSFYRIENAAIYGPAGTEIRFAGIRNNIEAIRSYEGCDVTYCEEAENVSYESWEVLIPTVIRKPGSCMIIGFNPVLAKSNTYQRWVVNPPPNCVVTKINYTDNPFLSDESRDLAENLKLTDPEAYQNIWLGFPKSVISNSVYGQEIRLAQQENRLTRVPYDPTVPVDTFWDLGRGNNTAVIFGQYVAMQFRVIDYIEDRGKSIHAYLQKLQEKPYIYGTDYLPHDARAKTIGTKRSVQEIMQGNGRKVKIVPRLSVQDGIEAARSVLFPNVWIDDRKCARLIECLQMYRYDLEGRKPEPIHDEYSDGADAWRMLAISLKPAKNKPQVKYSPEDPWNRSARSNQSWMNI